MITGLELYHDWLDKRMLSLSDRFLPLQLAEFLPEIEHCAIGAGVISPSRKDEIESCSVQYRQFSMVQEFMYAETQSRDNLGQTPDVADVMEFLKQAKECQDTMQTGLGWNMKIHYPLLHRAVYGPTSMDQLVGVMPCPSAEIIRDYLPPNARPSKISFCYYIDPEQSYLANYSTVSVRRLMVRSELPGCAVNHADCPSLRHRPMAIAVVTRPDGGEQKEAELELATWQAAQWKLLERLTDYDTEKMRRLPFLPGIIVQGHDWSFVASIKRGTTTTFYSSRTFGSTSSAVGIYKLIYGLQRLGRWVDDVYWAWYSRDVLDARGPAYPQI